METANSEKHVFSLGDPTVTARCPRTNRLYEVGSGALPHDQQTANFVREAALATDMPKSGERDPVGREYETGTGCLTKTAQRAIWDRNAKPAQAKGAALQLAADDEAALAAMVSPFLNDNTDATKH